MGQVITLFGEPDYITENYENMFGCAVSAEDKEGNVIYLEIYHGPSGPAIGGAIDSEGSAEREKAAVELATLIMSAEAADYDWEGVYLDVPATVKMGVKNGKPYYGGGMLDLSDEEFSELYESIYGY